MDLQAVRRERRRVHLAQRTGRDRRRHPRADGPETAAAPVGGRAQVPRAARPRLPQAGPQPGRRHHHRGVHGVLSQGRGDHAQPADVRRRAMIHDLPPRPSHLFFYTRRHAYVQRNVEYHQ